MLVILDSILVNMIDEIYLYNHLVNTRIFTFLNKEEDIYMSSRITRQMAMTMDLDLLLVLH
jgi:hypothetical protein